jgi:dihydrodipicolinate synthase/N-acetylneuraminate lyase
MAMLGLLEEVYRLPMVPPREASRARIAEVLASLKPAADSVPA